MATANTTAILLIHCPDQRGLVAAVSGFIGRHGGNIVYLDQHVDVGEGVFFMRVAWELEGFGLPASASPRNSGKRWDSLST